MADSNGSKKRKFSYFNDDDHDDELATEEQKIDKFYSLINSMREARDRLIMIHQSKAKKNEGHDDRECPRELMNLINKRKMPNSSTSTSSTTTTTVDEEKIKEPRSFQREDHLIPNRECLFKVPNSVISFGTSSSSSSSSSVNIIGAGSNKKEYNQIGTNDGLDLSLSL